MSENQAAPVAPVESKPADVAPAASAAPAAPEAALAKAEAGKPLTQAEKTQLKEYKLKVNGKEKALKLDLGNDEEVSGYLQKAMAADEKFAESAEVRKLAMQLIQELKTNPKGVLSDPTLGIDVRKLAEEIMNEQIAEMEKSPEQKEKEKLLKELETLKKEKEENLKKAEAAERAEREQKHQLKLETEIMAVLDVAGLPKQPRTIAHMADYMILAAEAGYDVSAKEIAQIVKGNTLGEFKEIVKALSDDQLEDFMGKEILTRLRKKNIKKVEKAIETASSIKSVGEKTKEEPMDDLKPIKKTSKGYKDFFGV